VLKNGKSTALLNIPLRSLDLQAQRHQLHPATTMKTISRET